MRISENAAFTVQTLGGMATLAGGTLLWMGSFGRVCSAPNANGAYTVASNGPSFVAVGAFASCFFYTGFNLSGKLVRKLVDVEAQPVRQAARNRFQ